MTQTFKYSKGIKSIVSGADKDLDRKAKVELTPDTLVGAEEPVQTGDAVTPTFLSIDWGRRKERGDKKPPHAVTVLRSGSILPSELIVSPSTEAESVDVVKPVDHLNLAPRYMSTKDIIEILTTGSVDMIESGGGFNPVVVFTEQSDPTDFLDELDATHADVRLVNQFEVHKLLEARGFTNKDDLEASKIIMEIGLAAHRATNGAEPRKHVPSPELRQVRDAYRSYSDITKLLAGMKNRSQTNHETEAEPEPRLEPGLPISSAAKMMKPLEQAKYYAHQELSKALKALGIDGMFDDVIGIGPVAIGFWATTRPTRFPVVGAWLKYAGFRADVETSYNHEMAGIMHNVVQGIIKGTDPTYYPLYLQIKERFRSEHPEWPPHRVNGKAMNRIKTLILKEVWKRFNLLAETAINVESEYNIISAKPSNTRDEIGGAQ